MIHNLCVYLPFSILFLLTVAIMKRKLSRFITAQMKIENNSMTLMTMKLVRNYFNVWMKKPIINYILNLALLILNYNLSSSHVIKLINMDSKWIKIAIEIKHCRINTYTLTKRRRILSAFYTIMKSLLLINTGTNLSYESQI